MLMIMGILDSENFCFCLRLVFLVHMIFEQVKIKNSFVRKMINVSTILTQALQKQTICPKNLYNAWIVFFLSLKDLSGEAD